MSLAEDPGQPAKQPSVAERLRAKFGPGVNPTISLEVAEEPSKTSRPPSGILERLGAHGLKESRYRLRGEIARGGMGAILKVWDEDIRRELAMKVVLGKSSGGAQSATASVDEVDPRALGRFLEEAQITGQLDHPGVVPVHELGLDSSGQVYFTMRLVRGRDLQEIFGLVEQEQEGWNTVRALGVLLKVCEAMAYAHAKGVIHRDLKPANIMVGRFGEVYVMDWGLARVLGQPDRHDLRLDAAAPRPVETDRKADESAGGALRTMDGDVIGTPAYMSPEQARGRIEELGPRTDVYALGALLYQLLTGTVPYTTPGTDPSPVEILQRCWAGPPPPLETLKQDVPAELAAICEKAMAREPAARYADMQELGEDLRAYLEHRVVKAYQTGAVAEFKKWVKRNRGLATVSGVALFGSLLGLGVLGWVEARGRRIADEQKAIAQDNERKANDNAAEARRQEEIARRERSRVLRLSAAQKLGRLQTQSRTLWPAHPENIPAYEAWLGKARALVAGLHPDPAGDDIGHYAQLDELRSRATPGADGELAFANDQDRWWYGQLTSLIAALEEFSNPESGLISGISATWGQGIERRLVFAREVAERTTTGPAARAAWAAAISSSADPGECPLYAGLTLVPQLDLLPIGRDPASGLWEFVHVQTGETPERGADGKLVLTDGTGLVFVLLPGGTFQMGAQPSDPAGTNYYPGAHPNEAPVHAVTLEPFFISKYEMTQGQWLRFTGRNPSQLDPRQEFLGRWITLQHPVEEVSWETCTTVLGQMGLVLPTEAQWEYAARAGTTTPWYTGAERNALLGHVNIADQAGKRGGATWPDLAEWPELDDGYVVHAPAGSFLPNGFGLHEIHGNVWEWCADLHGKYDLALRPGTGERVGSENRSRAIRGGGYGNAAPFVRSAYRHYADPVFQQDDVGLRPARALQR
jgi:formylglycine-generating enzyme required for sulfatase activity/serine/threonine protein kinase